MDSDVPPSTPPPLPPVRTAQPGARLPGRPPRNGWKILSLVLICVLAVIVTGWVVAMLEDFVSGPRAPRMGGPRLEEILVEHNDSGNKVLLIPIEGIITSQTFGRSGYNMVYFIADQLKVAADDDRVKAVILKVNSPGGEVLASDEIAKAIARFQEETDKPVVVSMGSLAASGGYYVSVPCRWIVAHELTITGSIGVLMHGYNYRELMDKVGVRPEVYKSGRFKDMLSGQKREAEITDEERAMVQNLVDETFQKFKGVVALGRKKSQEMNRANSGDKGRRLSDSWVEYADGRVLSGEQAYEFGFVDELGDLEIAIDRAHTLAGIEKANLVQYQQVFDLMSLFRLFGQSEGTTVKIDWGLETPKLQAGHLYFLSPTFVR